MNRISTFEFWNLRHLIILKVFSSVESKKHHAYHNGIDLPATSWWKFWGNKKLGRCLVWRKWLLVMVMDNTMFYSQERNRLSYKNMRKFVARYSRHKSSPISTGRLTSVLTEDTTSELIRKYIVQPLGNSLGRKPYNRAKQATVTRNNQGGHPQAEDNSSAFPHYGILVNRGKTNAHYQIGIKQNTSVKRWHLRLMWYVIVYNS